MIPVEKNNWFSKFENKVLMGFSYSGISCEMEFAAGRSVLFGVSGGADSMAMLVSCLSLREKLFGSAGAHFVVVTVDHNIRTPEESNGDARFVQNFCLENNVPCRTVVLPPGRVHDVAAQRGRGVEESARFLRYQAFEKIAAEEMCGLFCLAHNRNDQLETLVMRFLQGSSGGAASGIPRKRGVFFRPMLDISRQEIERYLIEEGVSFRVDKTNADESYLRNRVRGRILPLFDSVLPGWDKAVLAGGEKNAADNVVLEDITSLCTWERLEDGAGSRLCISTELFFSQPVAIRRRLMYKAFELLGGGQRIPYSTVRKIIMADAVWENGLSASEKIHFSFSVAGSKVSCSNGYLCVEKIDADRDSCSAGCGFYAVISEPGEYSFPCGVVAVSVDGTEAFAKGAGQFMPPFVIRNAMPTDKISCGAMHKDVFSVLSERGVPAASRCLAPVVERPGCDDVFLLPVCFQVGFANDCSSGFTGECVARINVEILPEDFQNL